MQRTLDPLTPKPVGEVRAELQRGILALTALLAGVENPLQALKFINNLVQSATNVNSLSAEGVLDAQFLRELVAFGFQYATLNPSNLATATENGLEAFLATLWQGEIANSTAMREATGKLSDLFEALSTSEEQLQRLRFETQLLSPHVVAH